MSILCCGIERAQSQMLLNNNQGNPMKGVVDACYNDIKQTEIIMDYKRKHHIPYNFLLYYDFYTTLTALHQLNQINTGEHNNIYFYYNVDVKSNVQLARCKWDFYFFNDYGVRHFFDSITTKTQDQLTLKNNFYYPIWKKKIYLSLQANTQTKMYNTFQYRSSNGERYLYDGFMSPGVVYYSGGITIETSGNGTIQIGLGSSKVTKIKNQKIFDSRETETINGITKGQNKKEEWGIAMSAIVPMQTLGKRWHWEMACNGFTPLNHWRNLKKYTCDANNVFHFCFLKYVRLSLRTKIKYEESQSPKIGMTNHLSVGFYLNNHL